MGNMAEIDDLLARDLCAVQKRLLVAAEQVRRRLGRANTEVEDLLHDGVLGAFQSLKAEAAKDRAAFRRLADKDRRDKMIWVATKVMKNKACDVLRRAYRDPALCSIDDAPELSDDRHLRARAARDDLDAIEAALSGHALRLYQLVLRHGRDDIALLAGHLDLSVSQTYRLLGDIKAVAESVTGRITSPRRVQQRRHDPALAPRASHPAALRRAS